MEGCPNPNNAEGAMYWVLYGIAAALLALVVSVYIPQIIPARATGVKL